MNYKRNGSYPNLGVREIFLKFLKQLEFCLFSSSNSPIVIEYINYKRKELAHTFPDLGVLFVLDGLCEPTHNVVLLQGENPQALYQPGQAVRSTLKHINASHREFIMKRILQRRKKLAAFIYILKVNIRKRKKFPKIIFF